jgi:acetyl-CoA acetyltransferase
VNDERTKVGAELFPDEVVTEDRAVGLETMCVGGGQGMAMMIERLS